MAGIASIPRILPVVLAGGAGKRLAPISTDQCPKPFVPLNDGESLFTKTLARLKAPCFDPPIVVGRQQDRFALLNHARLAGNKPAAILLEANGCNTIAAVALAVAWVAHRDREPVMLAIVPADHLIAPTETWVAALQDAAAVSQRQRQLCLLAAPARHAHAGYGYIQPGSPFGTTAQPVQRFIEKPAHPQSLIDQGAWWNMGQFVMRSDDALRLIRLHAPDHATCAQQAVLAQRGEWEFISLPPWPAGLPAMAFDRAVVERERVWAQPFTRSWQDLGTVEAWKEATGLTADDYTHRALRCERPWGFFDVLESQTTQVAKRLTVFPGCRLSLQRHHHRSETWWIEQGTAHVERELSSFTLSPGHEINIPAGTWHRLANYSEHMLIIKEIQQGNPCEFDIERREDDYGRHACSLLQNDIKP